MRQFEYKFSRLIRRRGEDYARTHWEVVRLPYQIGATHEALHRFIREQGGLAEEMVASPHTFVPHQRRTFPILFAIDDFLRCMKQAQDCLARFVWVVLQDGDPPPRSFPNLIFDEKRRPLPGQLQGALVGYWNEHGRALRHYRNFAEHDQLVFDLVTLSRRADDDIRVSIPLVSNPERDRQSEVTFDRPRVHAQPFGS